jgi:hypothetical protein
MGSVRVLAEIESLKPICWRFFERERCGLGKSSFEGHTLWSLAPFLKL